MQSVKGLRDIEVSEEKLMPHNTELPREISEQITWILNDPGMSPWLKTTLETALRRDPIAVVNDLEILNLLLRARCDVMMRQTFEESN